MRTGTEPVRHGSAQVAVEVPGELRAIIAAAGDAARFAWDEFFGVLREGALNRIRLSDMPTPRSTSGIGCLISARVSAIICRIALSPLSWGNPFNRLSAVPPCRETGGASLVLLPFSLFGG